MAPNNSSPRSTSTRTDTDDELVFAATDNKPSLVRSIMGSAPAARLEAAWPAAVTAAAGAGDAYVLEILLQHHQPAPHNEKPEAAATKALHTALLTAAEKGHAGVVALLLKHRPPPRSVIHAAMGRALQGDHAAALQALLDKGKPDPYVRACAFGAEGGNGAVRTPLERAVADGRQRCVGVLRQYEGVWRQRTLQLLVRATLLDSCRLSTLPFAVIGEVLLECLAGRCGAPEEAQSIVIEEPSRPVGGKRELEEEEEEEDDDEQMDDQDFPPVFLQQGRGRKRRRSGGKKSPRRSGGRPPVVVTLTTRRVQPPRKAKTWSEMRKLPLPSTSFAGACAF